MNEAVVNVSCRIGPLALLACLLLGPVGGFGMARAQVSDEPSAAEEPEGYREAIAEGLKEFDAQNYEEARSLFLRAHAIYPNARTQRAAGMTEFELRNYVDSIRYLEGALASPIKPLSSALRSEAERMLLRAYGFVGRVKLRMRPSSAEVLVDGAVVTPEKSDLILLSIGEHSLEVKAPGCSSDGRSIVIKGGEERELVVVLAPIGNKQTPADSASAERRWFRNPWLWTGLSVVVLGAAAGTTFAIVKHDSSPRASGGSSNITLGGP